MIPHCTTCDRDAELTDSAEIYGRSYGPIWICRECRAYVGCHPGTTKPLGTLADAETREWRSKAHAAFDYLWRIKMQREHCSRNKARSAAYRWLSEQLGIEPEQCHIGMMSASQCRKVVDLCAAVINKTVEEQRRRNGLVVVRVEQEQQP